MNVMYDVKRNERQKKMRVFILLSGLWITTRLVIKFPVNLKRINNFGKWCVYNELTLNLRWILKELIILKNDVFIVSSLTPTWER